MKALIILGAIIGFAIGAGFCLAAGTPAATTLWRACVAALCAAWLTRWWSGIWLRELKESLDHGSPKRASSTSAGKPASKA